MNEQQLRDLIETAVTNAATTVAIDTVLWGVLGAALLVAIFLFILILMKYVMGPVEGSWSGAWSAVLFVAFFVIISAGSVIGGGEGFLHGAEDALRQSEFGRNTLNSVAHSSTAFYAVVYYADPQTLQEGSLEDLGNLSKIDDVRRFVKGNGRMDTERLNQRMEQFRGQNLKNMAQDVRKTITDNPILREQLPGVADAADLVVEFGFEERLDQAAEETASGEGPMGALLHGVPEAAALDGDPTTVTQGELADHMMENVVVPAVMSPLKAVIRPWQYIAAIAAGIVAVFAYLFRIVAWNVGRKDEDQPEPQDDPPEPDEYPEGADTIEM